MKKVLALIISLAMVFAMFTCCTVSAAADDDTTYVVGICQLLQHDALDAASQGFMDALTDALGDKVEFDYQNAQGESTTCSTIVTGFVSNEYDLIMCNATPALQAAVAATTTIPILATSITDFGVALADEEMDPTVGTGINVSGTSDGVPGYVYAELVNELCPDAATVAVLYCSAEANSVVQADSFIEAMGDAKECIVYTFADSNDMQAVVTAAASECDCIYIPTDNTAASNMTIVSNVCIAQGVPVICGEENMMAAGGLATASISYYDIGYVCGQMAVEILVNGADVSTMPIGYAATPAKEYNPEFADAIGFEIPEGYEAYSAE